MGGSGDDAGQLIYSRTDVQGRGKCLVSPRRRETGDDVEEKEKRI